MAHYFVAEWSKLRKIQLLSIGLIFLGLASFIGLGIYFANREVLIEGTQDKVLWGQLTFYYSQILYAPMLAIFVVLSLAPEFERKTLELLRSNAVSIHKLLISKMLVLSFFVLVIQFLLLVIYSSGLKAAQLSLSLPEFFLPIKWVGLSLLGSIPLLLIQTYIYAKTRQLGHSVGISAIGSMGGFVLLFINDNLTQFYPYSQPMIALRSRTLEDFSWSGMLLFLAVNLIFSLLFYNLSYRELSKIG